MLIYPTIKSDICFCSELQINIFDKNLNVKQYD